MITSVELKNFQNHKHLSLELGRFTTLSGPSNSGKTAVLRALAAMLRNDSAGDFLPWDGSAKNISVRVVLEDGHEVLWEKGRDNQYTITRPDGTVSALKKVGASVPDEVMDVLRIGPIVMEDGTKAHINLHEQQESPFLLMDTPGYVAKVFGELTSAGKLFTAANEGNRRTREEKKTRSLREADIAVIHSDLTAYDDLDATKAQLEQVAEKVSTAKKISTAHDQLLALVQDRLSVEDALRNTQDEITRLEGVEKVDIGVLVQLNTAATQLSELISTRQSSCDALVQLDEQIPGLERAAAVDLGPLQETYQELRSLEALCEAHAGLSSQIDALPDNTTVPEIDFDTMLKINTASTSCSDLLEQYWAAERLVVKEDEMIEEATRDLERVNAELDEIDTCPTCGQEVTAEHLTGASVLG